MTRQLTIGALFFLMASCQVLAQSVDSLRQKIQHIVADKDAIVCVSVVDKNGKDVVSLNGARHCPMHSVFKFHIALAVLDLVDKGRFSLDQKVVVQKKDLLPDLWSPLREENPDGGSFSISKLLEYNVSMSDNVGCDVLLRLIGGPEVVEAYLKKSGIKDVSIKFNEEAINANPVLMFQNWTTPNAANKTLAKFYGNKKKLLSPKSYDFLWTVMRGTKTGAGRLKGQLPEGIIVAHKTGSSGTDKEGLTAAVNDMGIVFLPNGQYFFITVFVTNSKENDETNEKIIADIAKAVWDYWVMR